MLVEPIEIVIHENIMPWVLDKMADFLNDEDYIDINTEDVVRDAFEAGKQSHKEAIEAEYKRRQDEIFAAEQKIIQKQLDKQARRDARERRRKEEELKKLRAEIKANFVDRGEVKEHILQ